MTVSDLHEGDLDLLVQVDSAIAHLDELEMMTEGHPDRHASLEMLSAKLHAMIVGQAASELLEHPEQLPDEAGLWVAPSWTWLFSRISVGRKDRASDGSRLRLPVRVEWSQGPVSLVPLGRRRRHSWTSVGLGHSGSGSLLVGATHELTCDQVQFDETGLPSRALLRQLSRHRLEAELKELTRLGSTARWETLLWLEPYVERALRLAHASVSTELSSQWGDRRVLLDDTKLKTIADQMLLGDDRHPGKVSQLLERCLAPTTFRRVEPVKYIKESLRRDANAEIRRAIGDPRVGSRVRKVAQDLGTDDLDQIVEEFRRRYPYDRLARSRAEAALSVSPDPMASWWGLYPEDEV